MMRSRRKPGTHATAVQGDLGFIFLVLAVMAVIVMLIYSMYARNYCRLQYSFMLQVLELQLGLARVYVPPPISITDALIPAGKLRPDKLSAFFRSIARRVNGVRLAELSMVMCSVEATTFFLAQVGCQTTSMIQVISAILFFMMLIGVVVEVFALFVLLYFWFVDRTVLTRRAVMLALGVSASVVFAGWLLYFITMLTSNIFYGNWFTTFVLVEVPVPAFGMGWGFAMCSVTVIMMLILPFWAWCLLPESVCDDYEWEKRVEAMDDEDLIRDMEDALEDLNY